MTQPRPIPGKVNVAELVIADMQVRVRHGLEKYGTLLQTNNGRDPLQDAYEKAIDMVMYLKQALLETKARPVIVCLCGSTRFLDAFRKANLEETLAGHIVLSIGCDMRTDTEIFGHMPDAELTKVKQQLDELHKRKIDLADEILVLNVGGYIGQSTRSEVIYARTHSKRIRLLEPIEKGKHLNE